MGFERIGAFVVTAELDADKVEPFWTSLTKDFAALDASTFTPEQLERAKLNLEDDLYRSKETLSGLASKIGYFQFFMGGSAMLTTVCSSKFWRRGCSPIA